METRGRVAPLLGELRRPAGAEGDPARPLTREPRQGKMDANHPSRPTVRPASETIEGDRFFPIRPQFGLVTLQA